MFVSLINDLRAVGRSASALFDRPRKIRPAGGELVGAANFPATHGLAVRQVYGEVLHGVQGASTLISGITAADNMAAAANAGGPIPGQLRLADGSGYSSGFGDSHFWLGRAEDMAWSCHYSAIRLQVVFFDDGVASPVNATTSSITVVPFRIEGNGNVTRGAAITLGGAGGATEARDTEVAGRHTFYRISAITLAGDDTSASLFIAGEGAGFMRSSDP